MTTIFVSHASHDDTLVEQLEAWLRRNDFTDFFIDHDARRGIVVGEKWADALRSQTKACRVVICLVTRNWLSSSECFGEFMAAWYMGKRIIPLVLGDAEGGAPLPPDRQADVVQRLARVLSEDQGIDMRTSFRGDALPLHPGSDFDHALQRGLRAAGAMSGLGLDPEAFEADPQRSPFPGLAAFGDDDADAALLYGRSGAIAAALEKVRSMRALGANRALAFIGASGSGKSSLLKAGILPRLRRERAFAPLRTIRVGGSDPLGVWLNAWARGFAERSATFDALEWEKRILAGADDAEALSRTMQDLRLAYCKAWGRPDATLVAPLDQAEELVAVAHGPYVRRADALAACFRALARTDGALVLLTVRSDLIGAVQGSPRFGGFEFDAVDVRPVEHARYAEIIEGPARRVGLKLEAGFVEAMLGQGLSGNALPLVAFALERLWRQRIGSELSIARLQTLGGVAGIIKEAADRALAGYGPDELGDAGTPSPADERLGRLTFVPHLVGFDESGAVVRRVALLDAFDDARKALLRRFERWRLVVIGRTQSDAVVEVVHESLLREWARISEWLAPERERMAALLSLQRSAHDWERSGRRRGYLVHRGRRLAQALELRGHADYQSSIDKVAVDYLASCSSARARQRVAVGAATAMGLGAVAFAAYVWHDEQRTSSVLALAQGLPENRRALASRIAASALQARFAKFLPVPSAARVLAAKAYPTTPSNAFFYGDDFRKPESGLRPVVFPSSAAVDLSDHLVWLDDAHLQVVGASSATLHAHDKQHGVVRAIRRVVNTPGVLRRFAQHRSEIVELTIRRSGRFELTRLDGSPIAAVDVGLLDLAGVVLSADGTQVVWWTDTPSNAVIGLSNLVDKSSVKWIGVGETVSDAIVGFGRIVAIVGNQLKVIEGSELKTARSWTADGAARLERRGDEIVVLRKPEDGGGALGRITASAEWRPGPGASISGRELALGDAGQLVWTIAGARSATPRRSANDGAVVDIHAWQGDFIVQRQDSTCVIPSDATVETCRPVALGGIAVGRAAALWVATEGAATITALDGRISVDSDLAPKPAPKVAHAAHGNKTFAAVEASGRLWFGTDLRRLNSMELGAAFDTLDFARGGDVVAASGQGGVVVTDLAGDRSITRVSSAAGARATFSSDGRCLLVVSKDDGTAILYDERLRAGAPIAVVGAMAAVAENCSGDVWVVSSEAGVQRFVRQPDGRYGAAAQYPMPRRITNDANAGDQNLYLTLDAARSTIYASGGSRVVALDARSLRARWTSEINETDIFRMTQVRGDVLVALKQNDDISAFRSHDGARMRVLFAGVRPSTSVAFGPEGNVYVVGRNAILEFARLDEGLVVGCVEPPLTKTELDLLRDAVLAEWLQRGCPVRR